MDSNGGINGTMSSQPGTGNNAGLGMLNLRYNGVPTTMAAVAAMGQQMALGNMALRPGQQISPTSAQQDPSMLLHQQLLLNSGWPLHHTNQMSNMMGSPGMQPGNLAPSSSTLMMPPAHAQQQHGGHTQANNALVLAHLSAMSSQQQQQQQLHQQLQHLQSPQQPQMHPQPQPHPHSHPHPHTLPQSLPHPQAPAAPGQQQQQQQQHQQPNGFLPFGPHMNQHQHPHMPHPMPPPTLSLATQTRDRQIASATPHSTPPTAASTPAPTSAMLPARGAIQQRQQQQQMLLQGAANPEMSTANSMALMSSASDPPTNPPRLSSAEPTAVDNGTSWDIGGRASSATSSSPALSNATRWSKTSPKALAKRATKESRRKANGGNNNKKATKLAAQPLLPAQQEQTQGHAPPKRARSRSVAAAAAATAASQPEPQAQPILIKTEKDVPQPEQQLQQQALLNMYSAFSEKDVLGAGIERLLAFHGAFSEGAGDLDKWTTAVTKHFTPEGTLRLDMGAQSFDVPACTAGRFYHRLFGDGGVSSMHVALGPAKAHSLRAAGSLVSFHGVMVTSTYVSGRRVIETGSLRVIFTPDFRIRVWAFSAADATICLPRKRPNSQDDAPVRTAEATIARNLDWPNTDVPLPRRRKSAHGRQPPEECVLPPGALRHAEVASAMYGLQALIGLQLQNPAASVASLLDIWSAAENVAPQKQRSQKAASSGPPNERKRARKRSIAAPAAAGKEEVKSTAAPGTNKPMALAAKPPAASSVSAPVSVVKTGL